MSVYNTLAALAIALGAFANSALADSKSYHIDSLDLQGQLPVGFVADMSFDNGNGRSFVSPDDSGQIMIYGKNDFEDDLSAYHDTLKGYYLQSGAEITLDSGEGDWFVISGTNNGKIFYMRVIEGQNCAGETVRAHWVISYKPDDRGSYDDQIDGLSKGLKVCACQ